MKIFCDRCKYLFEVFTDRLESLYSCSPPIGEPITHISKSIHHPWLKDDYISKHYEVCRPQELNKNNDCRYYDPLPDGVKRKVIYQ